jgi:NADPH:quinone reductase
MRQIRINNFGGAEELTVEESDIPSPSHSEILIKVIAIGVNFIDIYQRSGVPPYTKVLPFTPGLEGSGIITVVGADVVGFSVGDRVAWASVPKSYAEFIIADPKKVALVPPDISFDLAAAVALQGATAHYLVNSTFKIQPKSVALVHAAAGGTGNLICQMILQRGGSVIATTSSREKADFIREIGVDQVIVLDGHSDFSQEVRRINNGNGVDVVYDGVGASTFSQSLASLKPRGFMVLFGASSGQVPPFNLQELNTRGSLYVTRPKLDDYASEAGEFQSRLQDVFQQITAGTLKVQIGAEFELTQAGEAQTFLESRKSIGKIILSTLVSN